MYFRGTDPSQYQYTDHMQASPGYRPGGSFRMGQAQSIQDPYGSSYPGMSATPGYSLPGGPSQRPAAPPQQYSGQQGGAGGSSWTPPSYAPSEPFGNSIRQVLGVPVQRQQQTAQQSPPTPPPDLAPNLNPSAGKVSMPRPGFAPANQMDPRVRGGFDPYAPSDGPGFGPRTQDGPRGPSENPFTNQGPRARNPWADMDMTPVIMGPPGNRSVRVGDMMISERTDPQRFAAYTRDMRPAVGLGPDNHSVLMGDMMDNPNLRQFADYNGELPAQTPSMGKASPIAPPSYGTPYDYSGSAAPPPTMRTNFGVREDEVLPGFDAPIKDPLVAQNERDNLRRKQKLEEAGVIRPGDPRYGQREQAQRRDALNASTREARERRAAEDAQKRAMYERQLQESAARDARYQLDPRVQNVDPGFNAMNYFAPGYGRPAGRYY